MAGPWGNRTQRSTSGGDGIGCGGWFQPRGGGSQLRSRMHQEGATGVPFVARGGGATQIDSVAFLVYSSSSRSGPFGSLALEVWHGFLVFDVVFPLWVLEV